MLIGFGADIHARNLSGRTPLQCAAAKLGNLECAIQLVEAGARLEDRDNAGVRF